MQNLEIHVVLPKGFRLQDGRTLQETITFTVTGAITPYYASVDQIRLMGGMYLSKVGDVAISRMIYMVSKLADQFTYRKPHIPREGTPPGAHSARIYEDYLQARQNFVIARVAHQLILNVWDFAGARGSHTLANFSVGRQSVQKDEGLPKRLLELEKEVEGWKIVLKSAGEVGFAGHARGSMATKGMYQPDAPAGREWITSGMGANRKTIPGWGSEGKPVKFGLQTNPGFYNSWNSYLNCSPSMFQMQTGTYMGNYIGTFAGNLSSF